MVYRCTVCGYEYDEASEGKSWDSLPDDWICPVCGVGKELFEKIQTEEAPIKQEEARAPQSADTSAASEISASTLLIYIPYVEPVPVTLILPPVTFKSLRWLELEYR